MHLSTTATLVASLASQALAVAPLVNLDYSSYQGVPLANNITQWLGVRYAQPPVGNLRFSAPQDPCLNETVQQANAVSGCHFAENTNVTDFDSMDRFASEPVNTYLQTSLLKTACFWMSTPHPTQRLIRNCPSTSLSKAADSTRTRTPI